MCQGMQEHKLLLAALQWLLFYAHLCNCPAVHLPARVIFMCCAPYLVLQLHLKKLLTPLSVLDLPIQEANLSQYARAD